MRLVLDLGHTRLDQSVSDPPLAKTPITSFSSEVSPGSALRLVFNLSHPVDVHSFLLAPYVDRGDRLVLDLYPAVAAEAPAPPPKASSTETPTPAGTPPVTTRRTGRADTSTPAISFSGTWNQEAAIETRDFHAQKFEAEIKPRWDIDLGNGFQLTTVAQVRLDAVGDLGPDQGSPDNYSSLSRPWYNNKNAELSLRRFYLDKSWGDSFWRVGKQQVVWGQADGIKVLDIVNPQSFREFIMDDFDDSRIPLWTMNVEIALGTDDSLQFLWIPDTTYHELAERDTPYVFTSPLIIPRAPPGVPGAVVKADKPDNVFSDSDAALRYTAFNRGWDITLNYLYHYQDFPVPYQQLRSETGGVTALLVPEYERSHMVGGTLSSAFGDLTVRTEIAYNTDTFQLSSNLAEEGVADTAELASVIGLDWQLGLDDILLSTQWFQSHLLDYHSDILRDRTEHNVSLLYRQTFDNETWQLDALTLYSINNQDSWLQLKLRYALRSNLDIWLGGDIFSGDRDGYYGQFSRQDRMTMGMELGF